MDDAVVMALRLSEGCPSGFAERWGEPFEAMYGPAAATWRARPAGA
ncbi:MAG: hypothetical protein U0531_07180 [Dehalococcoidia bacterium]